MLFSPTDMIRLHSLSRRGSVFASVIAVPCMGHINLLMASGGIHALKSVSGETLPHLVMSEFESIEVATKWYYDDSGKDVAELRKQITKGWVSIIPGYEAG